MSYIIHVYAYIKQFELSYEDPFEKLSMSSQTTKFEIGSFLSYASQIDIIVIAWRFVVQDAAADDTASRLKRFAITSAIQKRLVYVHRNMDAPWMRNQQKACTRFNSGQNHIWCMDADIPKTASSCGLKQKSPNGDENIARGKEL